MAINCKNKRNYRAFTLVISTVLLLSGVVIHPSDLFASTNSEKVPTISAAVSNQISYPRTLFLDSLLLSKAKQVVKHDNNSVLQEALTRVLFDANHFLTKNPTSVVDKPQLPPSGNKHDFLSQTPYRWRNPNTPDGLPYIFRDGKVNPEANSIPDKQNMDDMVYMVKTLSLAYYFTDDSKYAAKAAELLRVWFLDNDTYMNPNLDYSEIIPGNDKLNPSGVMAGSYLTNIIDAVGLIENSLFWDKKDQDGIKLWFSKYLNWLLNSDVATEERYKINNHGTYYDVQVSSIALFLNKTSITKSVLNAATNELTPASFVSAPQAIAVRIQPDGRQPFELARSNSLDYSMFNLLGLFKLATVGEYIGIDLWNYTTLEGAGLKKALDYLLPYATKNKSWPYSQVQQVRMGNLAELLCQASIHYPNDKTYIEAYNSINKTEAPMNIDNYATCIDSTVVK
jgi:Alginate lyase